MNNSERFNCKCKICNKLMYMKPYRIKRNKNGVTCSKECAMKLRSIYSKGEKNHQFGLKGHLNSSFIGEKRINQYGYVMIYVPKHPLCDANGRYREHRYVIETSDLYDDKYFDIINNQRVLKKHFHVHHINGIKTDNRIKNLVVVTKSEHTTLHNNQNEIIRDSKTGKIIGVIKFCELLENPEVDNQQPSIIEI